MKPAARAARPAPRRSAGLRWALPPLLLLLRLGQILCTGDSLKSQVFDIRVMNIHATSMNLSWETIANVSSYKIQIVGETNSFNLTANETQAVVAGLTSSTLYNITVYSIHDGGFEDMLGFLQVYTPPGPVLDFQVMNVSTTEIGLAWSSNDSESFRIVTTWDVAGEPRNEITTNTTNHSIIIAGLNPGTMYYFEIFPQGPNRTEGSPQRAHAQTKPTPVSDLRVMAVGVTEVVLAWISDNGTANCRMLLESIGSQKKEFNIPDLKPGTRRKISLSLLESSKTQKNPVGDIEANNRETSTVEKPTNSPVAQSSQQGSRDTEVQLVGLKSATMYKATVFSQAADGTEGQPQHIEFRTAPGPVSSLQVTNVSTTEIGLAWSSNDSESFRIVTAWVVAGEHWNRTTTTTNHSITIGSLIPGTMYYFEIFPRGPNGTEGPSESTKMQTKFSAVFDIHVVRVTTTEMHLEWQSTESAFPYTYCVDIQPEVSSPETVRGHKTITLQGLMPGTLYNITITPEVHAVRGNSSSTAEYTRPNRVSNIEISTNTTAANISWQNSDNASTTYTYQLFIDGNFSNRIEMITDVGITDTIVTGLIPGLAYTVEIFARAGNVSEGASSIMPFCTDAMPVDFQCEMVPKMPVLVLVYACPTGFNEGFQLEVSRGAWYNLSFLESCSSANDTTYNVSRKEVTQLNFSTSYNISITTLSCGKNASPTQKLCTTSITDPPPPDGSPNITSFTHNSVKVKFSGFEASHGPIRAYALILTTGKAERPSVDVLKYRYEDFKNNSSDTYVTYLITTDERRSSQGPSEVLRYEIDVGNESTTCGYFNGKLKPLGSYRACVAGFTNIIFNPQNQGLIDGAKSYVTFSNYSDAVFLPQDPGVICGAVFGCIFGALVIVAVGGFIFWRKKRKDAKNNEVSFSQIKPKKSKLIKVENFEAYFKKQQADSNCGFAEEYEDLKLVGISQPKYAAELAENRGKNRYNNVLPYDISRVKLSVHTQSTDDYVNANYMPGYHSKKDFIATQGPLPNTLKDFWRMVWEKNVYAIVMLTKCVEQGRTKCEEYWPSKKTQDYGDITVAMTSEIILPEWTIRDFTIKNIQTSESHPLRQFHFTSWPDHGVPDTTDLLINFRYLVRDYMKQSPPESPILVHCSAGVGRTGTFIAIDRLIYQMENENTVDVYGIVYDLRMHRPLMVQTEDQYVFLNQCVLDIIRSQKDSKVDLIYQNTTAMTIYENLAPAPTFGKTNGYIA